jgi:hypothetical protein
LVFTREELEEVTELRKGLAAHEDTNPCLLICAPSQKEYETNLQSWNIKPFAIERKILKHPRKYLEAWNKIK